MAVYKYKNGKLVKLAGNYGKLPDAELSETSENAVQNKVITETLNNMKPVLLWTNPNPTSNFSPQTVTIDLTNYDIIMFRVKNTPTANVYRDFFILKNFSEEFRFQSVVNSGTYNRNENKFVSNGVYFGEGVINNSTNHSACIPYQIYGIKLGV